MIEFLAKRCFKTFLSKLVIVGKLNARRVVSVVLSWSGKSLEQPEQKQVYIDGVERGSVVFGLKLYQEFPFLNLFLTCVVLDLLALKVVPIIDYEKPDFNHEISNVPVHKTHLWFDAPLLRDLTTQLESATSQEDSSKEIDCQLCNRKKGGVYIKKHRKP